jgi:hypothetical protein
MVTENIIHTKNLIRQVFAIEILKSRTYKNKEITYSVQDPDYVGKIDLEIDHKHVHALRLIDCTFATYLLPYLHYDSI